MKEMKEKIVLFLLSFCISLGVLRAQEAEGGVAFVEGKTFAEALAMAKAEGKMLFVDCYTTWCGPCRMMTTKVFPQKLMGDYFNAKFVCLKVDMEKGEGPQLHKQWGVRAYPTFLFFDAEGKEVNRIVGGDSNAARFLEKVKRGIGSKGLAAMTARYDAGDRDTTFLTDYLDVLGSAYDAQKTEEVAGELLKGRGADMLTNARLYEVFLKHATPMTEPFRYVLSHKDEFCARYDKDQLKACLSMAWMNYTRRVIRRGADGKVTYDQAGMDAYEKEMKKWKVEDREKIVQLAAIEAAQAMGEWKEFAARCSRFIDEFGAPDFSIYSWVQAIQKNCKDDAEVKAEAAGWMKARLAALEAEKARQKPLGEGVVPAIPMIDFPAFYRATIAEFEN